jgi:hypothetical protein
MGKFSICFEENSVEGAVADLMETLEEVFSFQDSDLQEKLEAKVNERLGEIEADICAGLARPEFEKAIEDAKDRIVRAVTEAFDFRKKKTP